MDIYRIRDWEFEDDVESGVSVGTGEVATLLLTVVALLMTEPELVVATVEVVTSADIVVIGVSVGTGEVATLLLTVVALLMTEPELVVATVEVVTSADIVVIAAEVVGAGLTEVTC